MSKKFPQGWKKAKLGEIADIKSGGTPSRRKNEYWNDGDIPWIKISDIKEKYINNSEEFITQEGLENSSTKLFKKGTILFTIFATLGEVGILNIDATTNQAIAGINVNEEIVNKEYLYYFLRSLKEIIERNGRGVAQKNINLSILRDYEVLLPPLEEQERIVSILEKAEDALYKREESNRLLDEYLKSVFVEMFGDPVTNPKGWEKKQFNEVFDISSSSRVLKSEWKSQGIPFYRVRDIVKLSECGVVDNEFFVSEEFYLSLPSSKGTPQEDDIMVSATSTIGKCYIVKKDEKFYYKDADVLRFRKKIDISPKYFVHFMKTPFAINQIRSTFGITTVPHFTIVNAKKINMIYPSYELQKQFENIVDKIEVIKLQAEQSGIELKENFNSLMQRAFNGEL